MVGMTTTIPVEIILASGQKPLDLNNFFISHPQRDGFLERAEHDGFPNSSCAWIKGIYGAVALTNEPRMVVGVVQGDCSATHVLLEVLELLGIETYPFSFPYRGERQELEREIEKMREAFGVAWEEIEEVRSQLGGIRAKLRVLDELTWKENLVTGLENHYFLVSASDMRGDPVDFERELDSLLELVKKREPLGEGRRGKREVRVGYVGVPPIVDDLYEIIESMGARVVFNEVQRQFSMPEDGGGLVDQYLRYTYPYSLVGRVRDINREVERRHLDGIIHYVQSFCHRNMEDVVFKREMGCPFLTLECDRPGSLEAGARLRLENFIQVLSENV